MKLTTLLSFVVLASAPAFADEGFTLIHSQQLAQDLKANQALVFDANGAETRQKEGIIPGAKLLSSASGYDVAKEIAAPKTQEVVFYCGGPKCMASHEAASRAVKAGYSNVKVMADGITGWKASGQPVAKN
jgi:rhodanese-related sulfurtransferase